MYVHREDVATARDLVKIVAHYLTKIEDAAPALEIDAVMRLVGFARSNLDSLGQVLAELDSPPDTLGETPEAILGSDDLSRQLGDLDRQIANLTLVMRAVEKHFTQAYTEDEANQENS